MILPVFDCEGVVIRSFGCEKCRSMSNVIGCSVVFIQKFVDFCTSMFVRVASLKEMVLPFCMGNWILGDIIHWKLDVFYFFSQGKNIVVGGIEVTKVKNILDGETKFVEIVVENGTPANSIIEIGCWPEVNEKLIGSRVRINTQVLESVNT